MLVFVTFAAGRPKTEEGPFGIPNLCASEATEVHEVERMAVSAPSAPMSADQFVAGFRVVKILLAVGPVNKLERPANVLSMALGAVSPLLVRVDRPAMESTLRLNPGSNRDVAGRADEDWLCGSEHMALGAG